MCWLIGVYYHWSLLRLCGLSVTPRVPSARIRARSARDEPHGRSIIDTTRLHPVTMETFAYSFILQYRESIMRPY